MCQVKVEVSRSNSKRSSPRSYSEIYGLYNLWSYLSTDAIFGTIRSDTQINRGALKTLAIAESGLTFSSHPVYLVSDTRLVY